MPVPNQTGSGVSPSHQQAMAIVLIVAVIIVGIVWWYWPTKPVVVSRPTSAVTSQVTPTKQFTIGRRDRLVNHVAYGEAINLAEQHGLDIYLGKGKGRRQITPAAARWIDTRREQVNVVVFRGDRFNLDDGTFTPSQLRKQRRV